MIGYRRWIVSLGVVGLAACQDATDPTSMKGSSATANAQDTPNILTIDHAVPHISTVAANAGELVQLFVRERVRADVVGNPREVVLMVHGRSVSVLAAGELRHENYDWAGWLARSGGVDVFMLDFQGSGRSPRPKMDDPCNVPLAQQGILIPNPLSAPCPHSYSATLATSTSDIEELDRTVDYIRQLRGVDKVHLIGWSAGAFRVGPYAADHADKVASLFLFAPIFNVNFRGPPPPSADPTPMTVEQKFRLTDAWAGETKCEDQVEPGIQDVVWNAIMENDELGRTWGPPEGVMRVRTAVNAPFQWNASVAVRITVPTLIVRGEHDSGGGGLQHLAELYDLVNTDNKLRFTVQCGSHYMQWEKPRHILHQLSKHWLKHRAVGGFTQGEFYVDNAGTLIPQP
jgi:pimeloyl-ACP methyl ester carboxylesterase